MAIGSRVTLAGTPGRVALVSALALAMSACGQSQGVATSSSAAGDSGPLLLTTSSASLSGLEAKASGRLVTDQSGCVRLRTDAGTFVTPAWPAGYRAQMVGDHFVVLDGSGSTVADEGAELHIGGGGVSPASSGWVNSRCAEGSTVWAVGQIGLG